MAKSIKQEKLFTTSPNKLYKFYMDEKVHSDITGKKAKIGTKPGESFSAFNGEIKGKLLHTIKNKLIVQTWRYKNWDKTTLDSVVTITLKENEDGTTVVSLYHSNIPEDHLDAVKKGWTAAYWKAWKQYLTNPPVKSTKTAKQGKTKKASSAAKTRQTKKTTRNTAKTNLTVT